MKIKTQFEILLILIYQNFSLLLEIVKLHLITYLTYLEVRMILLNSDYDISNFDLNQKEGTKPMNPKSNRQIFHNNLNADEFHILKLREV